MNKQMLLGSLAIIANHCDEETNCPECILRTLCLDEFKESPCNWELGDLSEEMQSM